MQSIHGWDGFLPDAAFVRTNSQIPTVFNTFKHFISTILFETLPGIMVSSIVGSAMALVWSLLALQLHPDTPGRVVESPLTQFPVISF